MCRNCFPSIVSTFRGCNVTVFLLGLPGNLDEDEEARTKKSELFHPGLCSCGCDSTYIRATGSDLVYKKKGFFFFFFTRKWAQQRQRCVLMLALAIPANRCPSFTSEHVRPNHVSSAFCRVFFKFIFNAQ